MPGINNIVTIAGGSGYIGTKLAHFLKEHGYTVRILSRRPLSANHYYWNPQKGEIDENALLGTNYIINLAGSGIADRFWTQKRKLNLWQSRVLSTRLLNDTIAKNSIFPQIIIQASAVGFYGNRPGEILNEQSEMGEGFLPDLCHAWEEEISKAEPLNTLVAIVRIGVVLGGDSSFITKNSIAHKIGLNIIPGSGKQYIPWVHIHDLLNMFLWLLQNNATGLFNAVSPQPCSMLDLLLAIEKLKKRHLLRIKIPKIMLKLILGDFSEVFLSDQKVLPAKFMNSGFQYKFSNLNIED